MSAVVSRKFTFTVGNGHVAKKRFGIWFDLRGRRIKRVIEWVDESVNGSVDELVDR